MAEDIVVIGAGGFGRETLDVIEAINAVAPVWSVLGVLDDGPADLQRERLAARGIDVLGPVEYIRQLPAGCRYAMGIGSPSVRARLASLIASCAASPATLIHPGANVGSQAVVGPGSIICGGVQVSTNVRLGEYAQLNPGAIIGHDAVLEDFVSINPGAIISGEVRVGARTLVGAGAVVLQNLTVGRGSVVGASACVTRNVPDGSCVVGVPARPRAG